MLSHTKEGRNPNASDQALVDESIEKDLEIDQLKKKIAQLKRHPDGVSMVADREVKNSEQIKILEGKVRTYLNPEERDRTLRSYSGSIDTSSSDNQ